MTTYVIKFEAIVEREIDVPNDLNWSEAYDFAKNTLGFHDIAHSPAAKLTINTVATIRFERKDR